MLLEAAPGLSKDHYVPRPPAMPASKTVPGIGCPLAGRCPRQVGTICAETRPPVQETGSGFVRCHVPVDRLLIRQVPIATNAGDSIHRAGTAPAFSGR